MQGTAWAVPTVLRAPAGEFVGVCECSKAFCVQGRPGPRHCPRAPVICCAAENPNAALGEAGLLLSSVLEILDFELLTTGVCARASDLFKK